jgi:hypothetical protein
MKEDRTMSTTLQTSQQPALHTDNITAHPGSTFAGLGVLAVGIGQTMSAGTPTTTAGWITFGAQIALGVLGMFGK